jgi:hypothetical protein
MADLARVGAARASTIVWMLPPSSGAEAQGKEEAAEGGEDEVGAGKIGSNQSDTEEDTTEQRQEGFNVCRAQAKEAR